MTWTDNAQCRGLDTDLFFEPERDEFSDRDDWLKATQTKLKEARALCKSCPVINDCLRANLTTPFGVFGGMSTKQRMALAKKHGLAVTDETLRREYTPMNSERTALVIDLYRREHSILDIESLTGINRGTVSRIVSDPSNWGLEGGVPRKTPGYRFQKSWAEPKYKDVRDLLKLGHNAKRIHRETGIHWKTVRRIKFSMEKVQKEMELANAR